MTLEEKMSRKIQEQNEWKEGKDQERLSVSASAESGILTLTTEPEAYASYLKFQADNMHLTPRNCAIILDADRGATEVCRENIWKNKGRTIIPTEREYGIKMYAPMSNAEKTRKGFQKSIPVIVDGYDISQTTGKELPEPQQLADEQLSDAIVGFVAASKAAVVVDTDMAEPALYDEQSHILYTNPTAPNRELFKALSREVVFTEFHRDGYTIDKDRYSLEAESVSYLLCRHYLGEAQMPDTSDITRRYSNSTIEGRTKGLENTISRFEKVKRCIDHELPRERVQESPTPATVVKKKKAAPEQEPSRT